LHVRVLGLEDGLDPDEYVKQKGVDAYRERLESALGYFHWLADRARARFDMRGAAGRVAAFEFLMPAVQKGRDKLERAAVVNDLASYLGVEPGLVLDQFKRAATDRRAQPAAPAPSQPELPALEGMLLGAVFSNPAAATEVLARLTPAMQEGFVSR